MDVGLTHRGIHAHLAGVLDPEGQIDHQRVERPHGDGAQQRARPVKGFVFGHGGRAKARERTQREAVGDACAQLAEAPVLDLLEHQRAQRLLGAHALAPFAELLHAAAQILRDGLEQGAALAIKQLTDDRQFGLQAHPLPIELQIRKAALPVFESPHPPPPAPR